MNKLYSHEGEDALRDRIQKKKTLRKLYREFYFKYADCIKKSKGNGIALEIGAGVGTLKDVVPLVVTSDILPYSTLDLVVDATKMPFKDGSVSSIFMLNALHHIPDAKAFFSEVERCLQAGGRILIIDQYSGWFSNLIYRYLHHEPYDPNASDWAFKTTGPLSGANGALCWIIFYRDRVCFEQLYPRLKVVKKIPHTPLRYWLSGGLKWWNLLPESGFNHMSRIDYCLSEKFPDLCSFVEVELVKIE